MSVLALYVKDYEHPPYEALEGLCWRLKIALPLVHEFPWSKSAWDLCNVRPGMNMSMDGHMRRYLYSAQFEQKHRSNESGRLSVAHYWVTIHHTDIALTVVVKTRSLVMLNHSLTRSN